MKSIGLFGDSFTGDTSLAGQKYHWSTLLAKYFDCELGNYGKTGSPRYFSYKQFLENYHKHDLNIFLITEPNRYVKTVTLHSGREMYIPNLSSLEHHESLICQPKHEDLLGWFVASDETYNNDMAYLMLEEVYTKAQNTIFIPCFGSHLSPQIKEKFFEKNVIDMSELQLVQSNLYGIDFFKLLDTYSENHSVISGHFVPEINELIYNMVVDRINTKIWKTQFLENITLNVTRFTEAFIKK